MKSKPMPVVLMADDDADDCLIAQDAFAECGAAGAFQCVTNGIELLERLKSEGEPGNPPLPSLILLDLNMPRKDGRQALKEIKSYPALQRIPVVVLTTSQDERDMEHTRSLGADAFITKPSTFDTWVTIMRSISEQWL